MAQTNPEMSVEIRVYDMDPILNQIKVGHGFCHLSALFCTENESNACHKLVKLTRQSVGIPTSAGEVEIELRLEAVRSLDGFPVPSNYCITNHNIGNGLIESIVDGVSLHTFQTRQVNLWMVDDVFNGDMCEWNKTYEAAIKIYGEGTQASAVRKAIRWQHFMLYSHYKKKHGSFEAKLICGIESFIDTLLDSNPLDRSVRFTYVVCDDSTLRFSVTNKRIVQDTLSKHALHANAERKVYFAGEFFVDTRSKRFRDSQKPALIVDNNSGTFAPPKEKLPLMKLLLKLNFGDELPIIALDQNDPLLKEYSEANRIE